MMLLLLPLILNSSGLNVWLLSNGYKKLKLAFDLFPGGRFCSDFISRTNSIKYSYRQFIE